VVFCFCYSVSSLAQDYTYEGDLTQQDIDQSVLYGSPDDIDLMDENKTYMDQIIEKDGYSATTGCIDEFQYRTWGMDAETAPGSAGLCANTGTTTHDDMGMGTFTFGYGHTIISQTQSAIANALKQVGITIVGYRWQWHVKNADTNNEDTNGTLGQDPLLVRVITKDSAGNVLHEKEWDYSYWIDNWQSKYGMEWYDPFITGDKIDTITLEVEGKDAGYWAGWYGPEFKKAGIYTLMVVDPSAIPSAEQDCTDPLADPTCPGYADALNEQQTELIEEINQAAGLNLTGITEGDDVSFVDTITGVATESIDDGTTTIDENIVEQSNVIVEDPTVTITGEPTIISDIVEETTKEIIAEEIAEETIEETLEEVIEQPANRVSAASIAFSAVAEAENLANSTSQGALTNAQNSASTGVNLNTSGNSDQSSSFDFNNDVSALDSNTIDQAFTDESGLEVMLTTTSGTKNGDANVITLELTVDNFDVVGVDSAIALAFNRIVQLEKEVVEETTEENEKSIEEQNAEEDALVKKAMQGTDDEDANAALLGYNPNFRAYQTPQIADVNFYQPKEIYTGQKNYDNPSSRLFNMSSDELHRKMVRQQYER